MGGDIMSEPQIYLIFLKTDGSFCSYGTFVDSIYEDDDTYVKIAVTDKMELNPHMFNYILDVSDPENMIVTEHSPLIPDDVQNNE
jgi:hypothetical protein|tara:strand:+ start:463 stop:717 length:255 start_codon:yes stop_codon:yes gene_type:complete